MARRNSSAADADWVIPLASSSVAAAIRSSIFCWRPAELPGVDGLRCRPLALAAAGAGATPERPDTVPLVTRLVVFISDFGPRLAKCADTSGVPDNRWGPNWVCGSDRSRSTLDRAPFCPARSTPYGFLRTEHLFKNDALMALQLGMIGRGNYALSMRRHKRQKSRFQCDGKCTKVGHRAPDCYLRPHAASTQPKSSNNRLVAGNVRADRGVWTAKSGQMRAEIGLRSNIARHAFPVMSFRRCLTIPGITRR